MPYTSKQKIMKKNFKKLTLNKKDVSNLSEKLKGGLDRQNDTLASGTSAPTFLTLCFVCPARR
jgi:hypothetical protein